MRLSVIIPVYNTPENFLRQCVDSVLSQTLESFEVILVDDGSDDPSVIDALDDLAMHSKIQLIRSQDNRGLPAARNTGIDVASGQFILNVDSDDVLADRDALKNIVETAELEGCDILRFNGYYWIDGVAEEYIFPPMDCVNRSVTQTPALAQFRSVFCFLINRDHIQRAGLRFNEQVSIGEDTCFVGQLLASSTKISSLSRCAYLYRKDNASMMRSRWKIEQFRSENKTFMSLLDSFKSDPQVLVTECQSRLNVYLPFKIAPRLITDLDRKAALKMADEYINSANRLMALVGSTTVALFKLKIQLLKLFLLPLSGKRLRARVYVGLIGGYRDLLRLGHRVLSAPIRLGMRWLNRGRYIDDEDTSPAVPLHNAEGHVDYFLDSGFPKGRDAGLSVMYRVKNEALWIEASICSVITLADQVVIVDNQSGDQTPAIIKKLQKEHPLGHKIEYYEYPFSIARCGSEHNQTPASSIHSLSYFYNWTLDKCRCRAVLKWDGDMVLTEDKEVLGALSEEVTLINTSSEPRMVHVGATNIYINENGQVFSKDEVFSEVRLFSNNPAIVFKKAVDFEVLEAGAQAIHAVMTTPVGYEVKSLANDEFSHWSGLSFDRPRKVAEYRTFLRFSAALDGEYRRRVPHSILNQMGVGL